MNPKYVVIYWDVYDQDGCWKVLSWHRDKKTALRMLKQAAKEWELVQLMTAV